MGGALAALQRDGVATDLAALLLGEPAPDARVLVRVEGEMEAVDLDGALAADGLGLLDLQQGLSGVPTGKKSSGSVSLHVAALRQV